MSFKTTFTKSILTASIAGLLAACGGSNNSNNETPVADDTPVVDDTAVLDVDSPLYIVKTTYWSETDEPTSYVYLTHSLDNTTVYDPSEASLVLPGYDYVAVSETGDNTDNAFYAAIDNTPTIERYTVNSQTGEVELDGTMDFTELGVTDARNALRAGKIYSEDSAVLVDFASMNVIFFDPSEMTVTATVDISAEIEDLDYTARWSVFPQIDGQRVIAAISAYNDSGVPKLGTHLVIADMDMNTVVVDSNDTCVVHGSQAAKDASGNIYFATSFYETMDYITEEVGSTAPCALRVESGADGWDDSYLLQLEDLTSTDTVASRPAFGLVPADGELAYTLIYSADENPLTASDSDNAWGSVWAYSSFDLTDADAAATVVEGAPFGSRRSGFDTYTNSDDEQTTWISISETDSVTAEVSSTVYDITHPEEWTEVTEVPEYIETIDRLW